MTTTATSDLAAHSITDLLRLSRSVLAELRRRGVVRSANAPAGDYGEYLVARAYGGAMAGQSTKSWDVRAPDGRTIQVKTRVVPTTATKAGLSPFRSYDFDAFVLVLLSSADLSVLKAVEMPMAVLHDHKKTSPYVNGDIVSTAIANLADPRIIDITDRLRAAAAEL